MRGREGCLVHTGRIDSLLGKSSRAGFQSRNPKNLRGFFIKCSRMLSFFTKPRLWSKLFEIPQVGGIVNQIALARMRSEDPLVWIDCEMTGLDPEKESIMSIACFITDAQLNLQDDQGWEAVIHHEKATLNKMDEWCTRTHGHSGLTAACMSSKTSSTEASEGLLHYIQRHVPERRKGLLAGNSVHCDRAFLVKAPYCQVIDHLNYRILDVSTIKEAVKRWAPEEVMDGVPRKQILHQAKEDILESIEEARYYREKCFLK